VTAVTVVLVASIGYRHTLLLNNHYYDILSISDSTASNGTMLGE
jgi:hypothetical protein